MSGEVVCKCNPRNVVVTMRNHNRSAFNGYRMTTSDYSQVRCMTCGRFWRSKAAWVDAALDAKPEQIQRRIRHDTERL